MKIQMYEKCFWKKSIHINECSQLWNLLCLVKDSYGADIFCSAVHRTSRVTKYHHNVTADFRCSGGLGCVNTILDVILEDTGK